MELDPARTPETIRFGRDFELDPRAYELRRAGHALKLERIPMDLLLLLVERKGQLVTREQIVQRIWGSEVFFDADNSINTAVRKLRQALRDDPEKPRVIQTITGKGYRFIAAVIEEPAVGAAEVPSPATPASPAPSPETAEMPAATARTVLGNPLSRRWAILIGVAFLLIAAPVLYLQLRSAQTSRGRLMLAVLPFENLTGDPAQEYFSDGLTEEMISRLGSLDPQRLAVIARTSVMHYKHDPAPLDQMRRELRVDYVLEGSVRRDADKVRITAQLIQVSDKTHLWVRQYDRELSSLLAVQMEIAQAVADQIQLTLGNGDRLDAGSRAPLSPAALEAYDLYLKGRYFWNKRTPEGFEKAVEHFQRAAVKDPAYARAYAGLADSYALKSSFNLGSPEELIPRARSSALRALELDDRLAEAHTSLALIKEGYDWDWSSAEKEFRRAIELDPNYATARHWYAELLAFQGRFDEALAESERARRLDPLSLIIATDHGAILYYARQYDRAIEQFRAVLAKDPPFAKANMVVWVYAQKGMFEEALRQIDRWRLTVDEPWSWAAQVYVYGRMGRAADAQRALEKLEHLARDRPSDPMQMLPVAYIGVDEKEKAFLWLEKALRERASTIMALKVEPLYDPLRGSPRFQELVRRAGLAE